ncbi:MAG: prepilin-type N-terminal cleavage/methylation domain-containing protein [Planctomycetota bacterium]
MQTIPIHTSPPRRGLTLAEVLVSIGILAVGLLGVASLFPVGGFYMQSGDVIDRAGAVAQSALDDAMVRGVLNPANWVTPDFDPTTPGGSFTSGVPKSFQQGLRDSFAPTPPSMASFAAVRLPTARYRASFYGNAYAIDPLGLAAVSEELPSPDGAGSGIWQNRETSAPLRRFPATAYGLYQNTADIGASWLPWGFEWPVHRVTNTAAPSTIGSETYRLLSPAAQAVFTDPGDLAQTQPEQLDQPARLLYDEFALESGGSATTSAAGRQTRGEYSWLLTVAPGSSEARDAIATTPDAYPVDVSVVVFHRRPLGFGFDGAVSAERLVNARVVTTSAGGGELLLEQRAAVVDVDSDDDPLDTPFGEFSAGDFVMLVGPHPQSTMSRPRLFLQWYRVVSLEDSGEVRLPLDQDVTLDRDADAGELSRVLVGLRGPDWPWQPANNVTELDRLSNDLRVAIIPGVAAVHTKTMRLESGSAWSVN